MKTQPTSSIKSELNSAALSGIRQRGHRVRLRPAPVASQNHLRLITAIHLYPIDAFVTYDRRQADVARLAGLTAVAPGVD